jgi:hypothetical protein
MKTNANPLSELDPLLSIDELAEYLGVPIRSTSGGRPAVGRSVSAWAFRFLLPLIEPLASVLLILAGPTSPRPTFPGCARLA